MNGPRRKLVCMIVLMLAVGLTHQIVHTVPAGAQIPATEAAAVTDEAAITTVSFVSSAPAMSRAALADLAATDPTAFAALARRRYDEDVREYSCVFLKQERVGGKLTSLQKIEVLFRDKPLSVYMKWLQNPDQCRRALYVADRYVDRKGNQLALVEPNGAIVRLFLKKTKVAIHGSFSKKASRRTIDQFGFKSTLDLLEQYNRIAEKRGVLTMMYEGEGTIDGRPTFIVVRHLPYTGADSDFPDARMVIHFDQEWLLPVAVYSWADFEEKKLLGSYIMTKVRLNPGFSESDFEF